MTPDHRKSTSARRPRVGRRRSTLTIDGATVTVPAGTSVMRAAAEAGIEDPEAVRHRLLEPFGSCRLCLVEIEGRKRLSGLVHDAGRGRA